MNAPSRHHVVVDLMPFGLESPGEMFIAVVRPCGQMKARLFRDDAPAARNQRASAGPA